MASWVLTCRNCGEVFTHSQIGQALADYFIPAKPAFPPEGWERECPSCKSKSIYQQHELAYRCE